MDIVYRQQDKLIREPAQDASSDPKIFNINPIPQLLAKIAKQTHSDTQQLSQSLKYLERLENISLHIAALYS